jgi:hypothetical protein
METMTKGIWSSATPTGTLMGYSFDKKEKYGWRTVDEQGELHWIDKGSLSVDHELYQRNVDNPSKVQKIAAEWSWMACGVLIVAIRQNGSFWVVDGQNRLVAALRRSDIKSLPCLLFAVSTPQEEAAAFGRINRNRRALSRTDLFKAEVAAGHAEAVALRDLLGEFGYVVGNPGTKNAVVCVDALLRATRANVESLRMILDIYQSQFDGERILAEIVEGFMFLAANGANLNDKRLRKRLSDLGHEEVIASVRRCSQFRGKGTRESYAEGIAMAVNKGLRTNAIEWRAA